MTKNKFFLFYFLFSLFISNSVLAAPSLSEGIDWSLPAYASQTDNGGMISETGSTDSEVKAVFLEVVWRLSEPTQGQFDWSNFQQRLDATNKKVLVRLEVNSQCHAPTWATIPALSNQSLQFWKAQYISQVTGFIEEFANIYASNDQIIGVQLGIADGEYYQDTDNDGTYDSSNCPSGTDFDSLVFGSGRDGWGEFWMNSDLNEDSESVANGLTPNNFEISVKAIIDIYVDAFGVNKNKLAFTNYGNAFGPSAFNAKLPSIISHSKASGIGNREGEIEDWMRYTGNTYGVNLVTGVNTDSSCAITFDENFADSISGKYWGDENEFFGPENWILEYGGPLSNQAYRFYMSSMRALQLRRSYISVRDGGLEYLRGINNQYEYQYTPNGTSQDETLKTIFHSGDFITYLSKTLGRTRSDTPDAFVILGEKTINTSSGLFPDEYKTGNTSEQCLIDANNRGYATVNEFGRWLSVVSPTAADDSMRKNMPENESFWGIGNLISDRNNQEYYELYARKSNEIFFDINDQLMQERCPSGCNIDVKVTFKDDHVTGIQLAHTNGVTTVLATQGGGETRTANFPVSDVFTNSLDNNADFSISTTDGLDLSVLLVRINIISALTVNIPDVPVGISPDGHTSNPVVFTWNAVSGATHYNIAYENNTTSVWTPSEYQTAEYFACASGTGTCSYTVNNLSIESGEWWVRAKNTSGESDWSIGLDFNVGGVPSSATLVSPVGTISDTTPTYIWNAVNNASWYYLWVDDSAGNAIKQWFTAASAGCASGTGNCSVTPVTVLNGGSGKWWVQTYNSSGFGAWSNSMSFSIGNASVPGKATLISPSGNITDSTPTYTWNVVSGASWYYLWVDDSSGNIIKKWYSAASAGCALGTCSVTPSATLNSGSGKWWVQTWNSTGYGLWSNAMEFSL